MKQEQLMYIGRSYLGPPDWVCPNSRGDYGLLFACTSAIRRLFNADQKKTYYMVASTRKPRHENYYRYEQIRSGQWGVPRLYLELEDGSKAKYEMYYALRQFLESVGDKGYVWLEYDA